MRSQHRPVEESKCNSREEQTHAINVLANRPLPDHPLDGFPRTRMLDDAFLGKRAVEKLSRVASNCALKILHQPRVVVPVIRNWDSHAPLRFLHDDCQDEARVDLRLLGSGDDGVVYVGDFCFAWVGRVVPGALFAAGLGDQGFVGCPHRVEVDPRILRWPALCFRAVAAVEFVRIAETRVGLDRVRCRGGW